MGLNTGKKSSWSACANLAAVRKDMLTSPESTFATYGRDTFIRFASAVCERPRAFIRRINFLRNAEPILSIAFTPHSEMGAGGFGLQAGGGGRAGALEGEGALGPREARGPAEGQNAGQRRGGVSGGG